MKKREIVGMALLLIWLMGSIVADKKVTETSPIKTDAVEVNTQNGMIPEGIFVEGMDLSGMNIEEAKTKVKEWGEDYLTRDFTFFYATGKELTVKPIDVGITRQESGLINELTEYGNKGNVVLRYKVKKDLSKTPLKTGVSFNVNEEILRDVLTEQKEVWDTKVQEPYLTRENGYFVVNPGTEGTELAMEAALKQIVAFFTENVPHEQSYMELPVETIPCIYSEEMLGEVGDILGSFSTSYKTSGKARSTNLENAAKKINGRTVYPGEEFSTISLMLPFTEENGYMEAHAYSGGRVIDSIGGGVCQISSTLYNAVLLAELEVIERYHHAMIVTYVPLSQDATVSESSGLDFVWMNNLDYPVYVECYTTKGKELIVNIYGVEMRPSTRRIEYVSEELSSESAKGEAIYTDSEKPAGFIEIQAAHTGHTARLWKVVYENGKETGRMVVNESNYRSAPRSATVGTQTDNPEVSRILEEAIATNDIDYVREIVHKIADGTLQ